jgi:hypothetical protein
MGLGWGSVAKHLPSMNKALGLSPSSERKQKPNNKLGTAVRACSPSTWEAEAGGLELRSLSPAWATW